MNVGKRETWILGLGLVLALVLGFAALLTAGFAHVEAKRLRQEIVRVSARHNALVRQLNARFKAQGSGVGAVLDAAGVPGGKLIGAALDSLDKPAKSGRRSRRGRSKTSDAEK